MTLSIHPSGLVGEPGFEPGTSSSRTKRAAKLRHSPFSNTTHYTGLPRNNAVAGNGFKYANLAICQENQPSASGGLYSPTCLGNGCDLTMSSGTFGIMSVVPTSDASCLDGLAST